ncbi:UNVERIFIED_CONTAM: Retrovirus-related Pol polyprotein from transposon TNT 1-94 [Sesamum radiatum]|uniref:Retrovirus-related Pol polyprotein from transposon TNT 1-94 n=1 Tax=Sesamum radiatum TaxID=300843 RepID=A0AAW2L6I9_SESRA
MSIIPYASAIGSIQYVVQCTRPNVAYALSVTSRYQACAGEEHLGAEKSILKYLKRTKDIFLIYGGAHSVCINTFVKHHNKVHGPIGKTVQQLEHAFDGGHEINCPALGLKRSKSRASRMGIESSVETCTKSRIHWICATFHRC